MILQNTSTERFTFAKRFQVVHLNIFKFYILAIPGQFYWISMVFEQEIGGYF